MVLLKWGITMGWGDDIMATAEIIQLQRRDPRPVVVIDKHKRIRWSLMWGGNPRISRVRTRGTQDFVNYGGCRGYVICGHCTRHRLTYSNWVPEPGELFLTDEERRFGTQYKQYLIINPLIKKRASVNKDWGFSKFQQVVYNNPGLPWAQLGLHGHRILEGVRFIKTPDIRAACAVISVSRGYVGTEGALHHAAAAFGKPAVVIFGGYIAPWNTGYTFHRNIHYNHPMTPCGWKISCKHCVEAMKSITVEQVTKEVQDEWCHAPKSVVA